MTHPKLSSGTPAAPAGIVDALFCCRPDDKMSLNQSRFVPGIMLKKSKQGKQMGMERERERGTSTWKFVDDIAWRLSDVTCGLSPGGVAMGCYSYGAASLIPQDTRPCLIQVTSTCAGAHRCEVIAIEFTVSSN